MPQPEAVMSRSRSGIALAVLVWVTGCGEPIPSDKKPAGASAPVASSSREDALSGPAVEEYFYNPAGKRDPFKPFFQTGKTGPSGTIDITQPPLQRWDVDKFVLSGVIWATEVPRALLIDPDGTGHAIQIGTYVGRNWGKVTSISDDAVVVTEEYQTLDGELVVNPVTVHFPGKDTKK